MTIAQPSHGLAAIGGRPLHGLVGVCGGRGSGKTTKLQEIPLVYPDSDFLVRDNMGHWPATARDARRIYPAGNVSVLRHVSGKEAAREAIRRAPCVLVLDEADVDIPANLPLTGALQEIVQRGRQAKPFDPWRRRGPVALLAAVRDLKELRTDLRKQFNFWYLGRCVDEEMLAEFAKKFGKTTAARQSHLKWGEFIKLDRS